MGEKSDPRGGIRSSTRHGVEGAGSASLMTFVLKYFVDQGSLDVHSAFLLLGFATAAGSFVLKVWSSLDMTSRVKVWLSKILPTAIVLLAMTGCGLNLGRVTPHEFTSISGETLIACEAVGFQFAFGDADVCRNIEGGHVSKTFADMTLGVIETAGRIVAGFFGGAGQGVAAAMTPEPAPVVPEVAPAAPPAEVTGEIRNPFLADPE